MYIMKKKTTWYKSEYLTKLKKIVLCFPMIIIICIIYIYTYYNINIIPSQTVHNVVYCVHFFVFCYARIPLDF